MDRRLRILELIDVTNQSGLELGALHNPIVRRDEGTVFYVDHVDTDALRRHYADDPNVTDVLDVDVVWNRGSLCHAVGDKAPVDYVIASHVIEHVPDPIGWLADIAAVLRPGGVLSLAIPDKRYCFDAKRRCTEMSDLVDAHVNQRHHPSIGQIFDFKAKAAFSLTTRGLWEDDQSHLTIADDDIGALLASRMAFEHMGDTEVHCSVFTPHSFVDLLGRLVAVDLLPAFEVAAFHPTEQWSVEFHVSLRRLPDELEPEQRKARQIASLPVEAGTAAPGLAPVGDLSPMETRLIDLKRRTMAAARRAPGARRAEAWLRRAKRG